MIREDKVLRLQKEQSDFSEITVYLTTGNLPEDERARCRIILESKQFHVMDGVLYHESSAFPKHSCVVPDSLRQSLLQELHCGRFAGHLLEKKVYDRLRRHGGKE